MADPFLVGGYRETKGTAIFLRPYFEKPNQLHQRDLSEPGGFWAVSLW